MKELKAILNRVFFLYKLAQGTATIALVLGGLITAAVQLDAVWLILCGVGIALEVFTGILHYIFLGTEAAVEGADDEG